MNNAISVKNIEIKMSHDGLYCINDLHRASGGEEKNKPSNWLALSQVAELERELLIAGIPAIRKSAGRYGGTYVSKELVYAYAMWTSARFHLDVIRVFDSQTKVKTDLDCLVGDVKSACMRLSTQIDKTSVSLNEIKAHGKSWGAYGNMIKKAKRDAVSELEKLKDSIQCKLDFMS